jgi:dTDP-4-amino-4,6-dideoxygalactose transaminase
MARLGMAKKLVYGVMLVYTPFTATKTISTGEGGMLVTDNNDLIEFAKKYRNMVS